MPEIEHEGAFDPDNALFGKYELGKLLGCGAFAKVYHARDCRSGHSVAVKVINKKRLSASPDLMSNIKREVSIMRRLNHLHIVKLHEIMATKTKIFFVMEFVKGGELFNKISKHGRFSEDLSRRYFHQLISAVGYCHSRGVYHRDLKPENLLIDDNGNLKVTDFGLSAFTDQIRPDGLLHTLCGTPAYVAPEILSKKGYEGAKVDAWSCGVVLFVLAAGYLPFSDPNLMKMYKKIYMGEFRCPKWMSSDLKRLLHRLLDTNPETRITIDEILKDPWFLKAKGGHKHNRSKSRDAGDKDNGARGDDRNNKRETVKNLNAFDLISFSSGLDLSGLFESCRNAGEDSERFVSEETPENLKEIVERFARAEKLRKKKKEEEEGVEMEGRNGNLGMVIEIYRLNEQLVVVEVKRRGGDPSCYKEVWTNKLRPQLISQPPQTA